MNTKADEPVALVTGFRILLHWLRTPAGLAAIALLFAACCGSLVLSYNGYCFNQRRFLSEQEYIDAAVKEAIRHSSFVQTIIEPGRFRLVSRSIIPFRSGREFRTENPDCCKLLPPDIRTNPSPTLWDRLFGYAATIAVLTYAVKYFDDNGALQNGIATRYYAVTNCGRVWDAGR
jgi:hypothetical protein